MSNYNMYGGYGRQFLTDYPSLGGKVFIVMSSTDARFNMVQDILKPDPDGVVRLYTDIEEAYDATTTNSNDVIYYFGGSASQNLTETLT